MKHRPIPEPARRKRPSLTEKLAACLAHMKHGRKPMVPGAENMTARDIVAAVEFHHVIPLELLGRDHPSNMVPQPRDYHRKVQTPKDAGVIAKTRRVRRKELAHRERMASPQPSTPTSSPTTSPLSPPPSTPSPASASTSARKRKLPSRPFPKRKRPLRPDRFPPSFGSDGVGGE